MLNNRSVQRIYNRRDISRPRSERLCLCDQFIRVANVPAKLFGVGRFEWQSNHRICHRADSNRNLWRDWRFADPKWNAGGWKCAGGYEWVSDGMDPRRVSLHSQR